MDLIIIDHGMTIFVQVEEIQDRLPVVQIPSHSRTRCETCQGGVAVRWKVFRLAQDHERVVRQAGEHLTMSLVLVALALMRWASLAGRHRQRWR